MKTRLFTFLGISLVLIGTVVILKSHFKFNHKNTRNDVTLKGKEENEEEEFSGAAQYYNLIKADPSTGKVDPALVRAAYAQADKLAMTRASVGLVWESRGPNNIGGRIRGFLVDKDDHSILYASGVSGGFYKSTNFGSDWVKIDYRSSIPAGQYGGLIISCMCQTKDGALYFGTGEDAFTTTFYGGDLNSGFYGGGIYKSTDKGETWQFLTTTSPTVSRWNNIQALAADPVTPDKLYAATSGGLYFSVDGGSSWSNYSGSSTTTRYLDVKVSPDGRTVFTVAGNPSGCRLYKSVDAGSLTQVGTGGSGIPNTCLRLTIAISPSNPNYVYICGAANSGDFEGVFRSKDNGASWTQILFSGTPLSFFGVSPNLQGGYDNVIAVDPYNTERFFVGGVDFYIWDNGFFYKAAGSYEYQDPPNNTYKNPYYLHVDHHVIIFDTVAKPYRMYLGSDGGIAVSSNAQGSKYPTYQTINLNLHTTQFYAIAISQQDGYITGGTQDNNCLRIDVDGYTGKQAFEINSGDGFYTEISKFNPNYYYFESQYGGLASSNDKGKSAKAMKSDSLKLYDRNTYYFNTPFRLWEDTVRKTFVDSLHHSFDSTVAVSMFYFVNKRGLYVTTNATDFNADSNLWYLASQKMYISYATCIEYTKKGDVVFVGGEVGNTGVVYRISGLTPDKFAGNPHKFIPGDSGIITELVKTFPNQTVTGIGISPGNDNNVVVTLGNYVASSYKHVYLSTNALDPVGSVVFNSIQGNLPNMPVYDGAIHSLGDTTKTILVGTELGMWVTTDNGSTWTEENTGMDRVPVFMIRQIKPNKWSKGLRYYIATHGLGVYSTYQLNPKDAIETNKTIREFFTVYPNPAGDFTNLKFTVKQSVLLKAQVYNLAGHLVKSFDIPSKAGENQVIMNTDGLNSGTYLIRLVGGKSNLTSKLTIIK